MNRQGNSELPVLKSLDEPNIVGGRLSAEPRGMTVARYMISAVVCLSLPPVLVLIPLVNSSESLDCRITHLMGFAGSLFLLANGSAEIRRTPRGALVRMLGVVGGILVGFHTLHFLSEFSTRSIDYMCYQNAAERIASGVNPYDGTGYLYPPLLGQLLAVPQLIAGGVSQATRADTIWGIVFYLFQFLQFFLVIGAYALSVRLFACMRKPTAWYIAGIATLFVVNNPLWRTLQWNQINLWVLVCILLFLVSVRSRPFAAGVFLSLGVMLKLYPALLVLPLIRRRNYRALLGVALGGLVLVVVSLSYPGGVQHWAQFITSLRSMDGGTLLRDNSIHSLVYNTVDRLVPFVQRPEAVASVVGAAASLTVLAALCVLVLVPGIRFRTDGVGLRIESLTVVAMLLLSPMVWAHHYILVVPALIYALATVSPKRYTVVGISALLMLLIPTFDLYPLSYHRLAGLLLLGGVLLFDAPPAPRPRGPAVPLEEPAHEAAQ